MGEAEVAAAGAAVHRIEESVQWYLDEVDEIMGRLQELRRDLQSKLYALRLGSSMEIQHRVADAERRIRTGEGFDDVVDQDDLTRILNV